MSMRSAWFCRVGDRLDGEDLADIAVIASAAGDAKYSVEQLASWFAACTFAEGSTASMLAEAEEDERERLWLSVADTLSETELLTGLQAATAAAAGEVRAGAAAAIRRQRIREPMLVDAAAAAALLAVHHHALARLANAPEAHPFFRRHALFLRGHWPLGYCNGQYTIY